LKESKEQKASPMAIFEAEEMAICEQKLKGKIS
jgi:hypothetical protein